MCGCFKDTVEPLSWTVHPLVENWRKTGLTAILLCFLIYCFSSGFQSRAVALLSAIFLIGSLYKYFLPFHYRCETDRLVVTACCYRLEKPWTDFRSFYVDNNGVLLSPFPTPTRLENFRGLYVRFGTEPPEPIVNFIRARCNSTPQESEAS